MEIGGLQKLSLIDYPGKLACVVFLIGCNFRCPYCYNSNLVLPEKIKKQARIPEKEFFDFLKKREKILEGVVLGGGEPTTHNDLSDFIKKIKKLGYLVKLDTNGSNPEMLKKLISKKLIDYAAMDVKQNQKSKTKNQNDNVKFKKNKYEKAVGVKVNLKNIQKSVKIIKDSKIDYEFRTTIVPGIHAKEDIIQIAKEISPAKRYFLQNFKPKTTLDPKFEKIKPYSEECLLEIQKAVAPFFEVCQIRI